MTRIAISLFLLLALCGFLFAETTAWQGFDQTPEDNWPYQANSVGFGYWGLMDDEFGGASPQSGNQYWASWNMGGNEGVVSFANQNLPLGYVYSLSFYYYTRLLSSPTEYSRYCLSYDNGLTWTEWTTLLPNTQAWTEVSLEIPVQHRQLMLKVAAKHSGTGKYAHWDSFLLSRTPAPPQAPVIYNIQIAQRSDGSGLVDIHYDLFDANNNPADLSLLLSSSAGSSFDITPDPAFLSGDIGNSIPLGTGKHIVWNAVAQGIALEGNQYKFRLLAEDGTTFGTVATPVFDPPGGTYYTAQTVSITCATDGASIYYTTDGSEPTEASSLYTMPISVTENTTIKATAYKSIWTSSETAQADYEISLPSENMVFVHGGTFFDGSSNVTITDFYIQKYEVCQDDFSLIMGYNPTTDFVGDEYPVRYISWYHCVEYCNRKSMHEGLSPYYSYSIYGTDPDNWPSNWSSNQHYTLVTPIIGATGYRLPTINEWRYAASGGIYTHGYIYSGSNNVDEVAWYSDNANGSAHPKGTKGPNELSLYDMSGNAWEWVWEAGTALGGGFTHGSLYCQIMVAGGSNPDNGIWHNMSFRIARSTNNLVMVQGGTFFNGTSDITLSSFYIDKYETTQANYQTVMGTNPSYFSGNPSRPVELVSWFKAIEYCNRRSMQEGLTPCYSYGTHGTNPDNWPVGWNTNSNNHTNVSCNWSANGYRLPTEMEWMFAAKGGNQSQGYTYSGSNTIGNVAWYEANSSGRTWDVGLKDPNELGTFDMSGNVWEWCWDIYGTYPSGNQSNPTGPSSGSGRVRRGGSWLTSADFCPVSNRYIYDATYNCSDIGFRCVRVSP